MTTPGSGPARKRGRKRLLTFPVLAGGAVAACGIILAALAFWLWPVLKIAPGIRQVNTDGFACSVAVAINLADEVQLDNAYPDILCGDLKEQFRSTLRGKPYTRIEEWLMAETSLYLESRSIPLQILEIPFDQRLTRAQENIPRGIPTLAIVILPEFTHCIVLVGFRSDTGFMYLDALQDLHNDLLPGERDFLQDYGVTLADAWLYTFELILK